MIDFVNSGAWVKTPTEEGWWAFSGTLNNGIEAKRVFYVTDKMPGQNGFFAMIEPPDSYFKVDLYKGYWFKLPLPWDMPEPEWKKMPAWAKWTAVAYDGFREWHEWKPTLEAEGWVSNGQVWVDVSRMILPKGFDYRLSLHEITAEDRAKKTRIITPIIDPCPFCGSPAKMHDSYGLYTIECQGCNAKMGKMEMAWKLVDAWNKRSQT